MVFQWHPLIFGAMVVVAIGTVIYTAYRGHEQHHRNHGYGGYQGRPSNNDEEHTFEIPARPMSPEEKPRKRKLRRNSEDSVMSNGPCSLETCTVCLEDVQNVDELDCGHVFHPRCIISWVNSFENRVPSCPVCRKTISRKDINRNTYILQNLKKLSVL